MTDRLLEQFFPDIEAADSFQAYDAPEGAVIALEAIEAEFPILSPLRLRRW